MKLKIKKAIWLLMAISWWGLFFPEFTLMNDTCRIVWTQEDPEEYSATQIYYKLLSAKPKQIKIKSRLLEILTGYLEKGKEE